MHAASESFWTEKGAPSTLEPLHCRTIFQARGVVAASATPTALAVCFPMLILGRFSPTSDRRMNWARFAPKLPREATGAREWW